MDHTLSCDQIERDEIVERYAAGTLPEDIAEAFEEHYFRCTACLARLEAVQETATVMRMPMPMRRFAYVGLAIAASLVVTLAGALVWKLAPVAERPAPVAVARVEAPMENPWAELGKFPPPPYRETRLRGAGSASADLFQNGISAYQRGNYAQAAPLLQKAAEANPGDARTVFFAGVSLLLAGDPSAGLEALRRVDALGMTPYQEEARFYQAKALLQQGDAKAARVVLTAIAEMHGDWEAQAKEFLTQIGK
ncbi:MAG: tetratricopeptide repeat protein [Acidobacteriota bacterium]